MSSGTDDSNEIPRNPAESSRGSSVSAELQEEYDEFLKHVVVTPKWDPAIGSMDINSLPQLRLTGPDQRHLTSIDEYSADGATDRTEQDSAVGSEEPETARKHQEAAWQISQPEQSTPRPMPSPGRTPYRGPLLSPTPSSGSEIDPPAAQQDPAPISSYLGPAGRGRMEAEGGVMNGNLDPDMSRMNGKLDQWYGKLKTMVLAELGQTKIAMSENQRKEVHNLKREHETEMKKLQDEMDQLKELLHTYEVSVERKDQVISNLTRAVQTGHDRLEMARRMMQWKLKMIDEKRQTFTTHLARKHRERALSMKAWQAWRSTIEAKWKERVEKACQRKAEEVCLQLTNDYEAKIASLNEALESSRNEVSHLHQEREKYEETMKKAFMRGVCALNLEAMSMFQGDENQQGPSQVQTLAAAVDALTCASEGGQPSVVRFQEAEKPDYLPPESRQTKVLFEPPTATVDYSRPVPTTRPKSGGTGSKIGVATGKTLSHPPIKTTGGKFPVNRSRTLSAKISAAGSSTGKRTTQQKSEKFGPPPHGVLVERHHPNLQNYQTEQPLSHVTKYPYSPAPKIAPQQMPLPPECFTKPSLLKKT